MVNEHFTEEQARSYMKQMLPQLDYWKRYDELSDHGQFEAFKEQLIKEINDLQIDGLPKVDKLYALSGETVNLEYTLPNGQHVKFLDDQKTYLGNQLEPEFGGDRSNIKSVTLEVFFMFREERYIQIKMELLLRQRCYIKTTVVLYCLMIMKVNLSCRFHLMS